MKYLPLVWAGLWRKRVRAILTMLSIAVAFVLFGALHGVSAGVEGLIGSMSDTRLRIMSRVNINEALPIAHLSRIETVPGVEDVAYYNFFAGYLQEPRNNFGAGAVDIERIIATIPDIDLAPEAIEAMKSTRNGAVIGKDMAAQRGWKVGDVLPLRSGVWTRKDGAAEWPVEIVGIVGSKSGSFPTNELWMNYAYFDEARATRNGTVTMYFATVASANRTAEVAESIDRLFANSMNETQSQNERDWIRAQVNQIGNMAFFINAIIAAVMFTLLFLTGNTMMQSVRERIPELAVLKTYGYSNVVVGSLIFAESLLLCIAAAGVGLGVAAGVAPWLYRQLGVGGMPFPWTVIAAGLGIAVIVAVVSALPPVWRAQRLSVVAALAGR
jgi:putative ABC transport system permease protein